MKTCGKCSQAKPLESFGKKPDSADGHAVICRECKRAYDRDYRQANADRIKAKNRRWWANNPDKAQAIAERRKPTQQEWRQANQDKTREDSKAYHQAHKQEILERHNRWRIDNPERADIQLRSRRLAIRTAWERDGGGHTLAEWLALLSQHDGRCAICATTEDVGRDHIIPLAHGGSDWIENIQPLCRRCNSRKGNSLPASISEAAS